MTDFRFKFVEVIFRHLFPVACAESEASVLGHTSNQVPAKSDSLYLCFQVRILKTKALLIKANHGLGVKSLGRKEHVKIVFRKKTKGQNS